MKLKKFMIVSVCLLALALLSMPMLAQDGSATADDVNAIAKQLYCPVCENVPLDTCPTAACQLWREEIRTQLDEGYTEDQIISDFVGRYGDRVVGTPQDPLLRNLSLITPWVMALAAVLVAAWTLRRWRSIGQMRSAASSQPETMTVDPAGLTEDDEFYRTRLEEDLKALG